MPDTFHDDDETLSGSDDGLSLRLRSLYGDRAPLIFASGAIVGSLALLCLFALLLSRSDSREQPTPTPSETEVPEAGVSTDGFVIEAVSESGAISVTLETPVFLNIAGEEFTVQPVAIPEEGSWAPDAPNETTALWAYGSVINYVFGLDDVGNNRALLDSLALGDEIVLTSRSGSSSTFVVSSRQQVSSDNRDVLAQRAPGVTLLLLEGDSAEQRLVVQGGYVLSDTKDEGSAGRVVEMGETAQLEGLQLTVTSVSYQVDRPEAPAGFAFYQVDYQVQNVGVVEVSASSLNMVLADDLGNLYALNPAASQVGNNPRLSGTIGPGQTVVATAGYQIPIGLSSTVLRWQVTLGSTGSQIQVNIPFQEAGESEQQAAIQVQQASVSPDGGGLLITGQITDLGDQPLVVEVTDISLTSQGTVYQIFSTNPAFPWTIGPGQTLLFAVTFQRPFGDAAVFTVLNQSFQLSGLR